jgi:hypothetical protein
MYSKILLSVVVLSTLLLSGCVSLHSDWEACNGVSKNIYGTGEGESFYDYWVCGQVRENDHGYSSCYPAGDNRTATFVPVAKQNNKDYVLLIAKPRIFGWRGTRRTEDGSLEAWLVRGDSLPDEYQAELGVPKRKELAAATNKESISGLYRMTGEAEIRYSSELSFDVEMKLFTEKNVPLYEDHFYTRQQIRYAARDPYPNSQENVKARQKRAELLAILRKNFVSQPAEVDLIYMRGRRWQLLPYSLFIWSPEDEARRADQRRLEKERAKGAAQP